MKLAYPVVEPGGKGNVKAWYGRYEDIFPRLKEMGYDGVELLVQNPSKTDTEYLQEELEKNQLTLAAIGTSPMQTEERLFLIHPEAECRKEARTRCSALLKLCARYQVPALVGKYRGQIEEAPGCGEEDLEAVLRDICREAESLNVKILLEPQNFASINNINTIEDGLEWIQRLGYSGLGLLADFYHMGITENSIAESLMKAGNHIGLIHMSDSGRKIPGEGKLPLKKGMETLRKMDYTGFLSPEIEQEPDSPRAAEGAMKFLKELR